MINQTLEWLFVISGPIWRCEADALLCMCDLGAGRSTIGVWRVRILAPVEGTV